MKDLRVILGLVVFFHAQGFAQLKPVEIPGSHVYSITSSIVNQEYELNILLPAHYERAEKKYPVLYLMDSQWDFPLLESLYGQQYYDGFIPELIVVGVTWGGIKPNADSLRARDYTPTSEKRASQSGGAGKFLSFLKSELIPFIDDNYKSDTTDRILMGCSLGGLFTLYTLFTEPELFQRYVAASPAFSWDNETIYQFEKKYFETQSTAPAKLYMCMGGVERGVSGFEKLAAHLKKRNYKTLQIETRVLDNIGHSGTKAEGYARGLQYIYKRPSITVDAKILKKYVGQYISDSQNQIGIKNEGGSLTLYFDQNNKFKLYAASETDFYSTNEFLNVTFKNENETITGFQLDRYNSSQFVTKVKVEQ